MNNSNRLILNKVIFRKSVNLAVNQYTRFACTSRLRCTSTPSYLYSTSIRNYSANTTPPKDTTNTEDPNNNPTKISNENNDTIKDSTTSAASPVSGSTTAKDAIKMASASTGINDTNNQFSNIFKKVSSFFRSSNASSLSGSNKDTILATMEQNANKHFNNPDIQADFYKLLLEYNYPQFVVSRYETPGLATNEKCMNYYIIALEATGKVNEANQYKQNKTLQQDPKLSNKTTAASMASSGFNSALYGSRKEPLHVIVTESTFTIISRWIKWLLVIGLLTYGVSESFKYITENTSLLKSSEVADKSIDFAKTDVKFDDVCGCDEARAELEEIVDFLKDPSKYETLGGKLPKGVLLTGPPGTGKTLLARATAGEAGVDFLFMSGSEFDEVYVGVGAKRIRDLFSQARAKAPAIIFIDELDAIGGKRNPKDQAYAKQTLNQLLVELDGFSQTSGIIIIGATNFPDALDKALTRPGRFDKIVNVELPDVRGRADILKHHMKKITLSNDVDPSIIARGTPGLSGAELANLVNQAAVYACQQNAISVNMNHLEWAKDKILMGAEKKTMVLTDAVRKATAYHEAGHAIMALYTPSATPLYKATILPRGRALGITFQLPEMDKVDLTKKECLARLDVCMGGKIAEELIYGKDNTTSGCGSDLQNATNTARAMVQQYGMSENVGPVNLSENWESWSGKIRDLADNEVIEILKKSESRSKDLLNKRVNELHRLANGLIEYETLDAKEIQKICNGEKINKLKMVSNTVIEAPESDTRKELGDKSKIPV